MSDMDFSSLGKRWYDAAENNHLDTNGRQKLYKDTEKLVSSLKEGTNTREKIQEACMTAFNRESNDKLIEWIKSNTTFQAEGGAQKFEGDYKVFHELFEATESPILADIDTQSRQKIVEGGVGLKIDKDPLQHMFSHLSLADKYALFEASPAMQTPLAQHEVLRYNLNPQSFPDLLGKYDPTVDEIKKYMDLLG